MALVVSAVFVSLSPAGQSTFSSFAGVWDLTVTTANDRYPSWLEIVDNAGHPRIRIVGRVSSVHPADQASVEGSRLTFMSKEYFGKLVPVIWEFQLQDGQLIGTQRRKDGTVGRIVGFPAPSLERPAPARWSTPAPLFNGRNLNGWEPFLQEPGKSPVNHYVARNGELVNEAPGANIRTLRRFEDFKLHVEFNCPPDGNSGVYLRGRYELQVEYERPDQNDALHKLGSIYGFLAPAVDLPPMPGTWESFDITLVGRMLTVLRNGRTIHDQELIPGITGGALDSREAEPGPIYIQGDHTGGMKYRNITVSVPQP